MSTIRERDADAAPFAWANPGDDQTELDRRTLLAALDALVERAEEASMAWHALTNHGERFGERWEVCQHPVCAADRAAVAAAKEASDG